MAVRWKIVAWFLGLAFGLSWTLAGAFYALGGQFVSAAGVALAITYMFTPLAAALLTQRVIFREPVVRPLGIFFRLNGWWLVAGLLPIAMAFAAFGVGLLMPGSYFDPTLGSFLSRLAATLSPEALARAREQMTALPPWLGLLFATINALIAGYTVNAVAGFGEEAGWRGLLLRELAPLGFWRSTALIGVIWGLWHAPLILQGHNYPNYPVLGVAMMTVFTLLLSPIITYVRLRARSVIAAAIFHGTVNASFGIQILYISGGNELTLAFTGAAGFIVMALTIAGIVLYDRHLARNHILGRPLVEVLNEEG